MHAAIRKVSRFAAAVALSSALTACNPDLSKTINDKFPNASVEQEEGKAVDAALATLNDAAGSNVLASLTVATIANAIKVAAQKQAIPVTVVGVEAQKQFLWIKLSIDSALSALGITDVKAVEDKYFGGFDPHITGQLQLGMSVQSNYQGSQDANTLTLHLLPALKSANITSFTIPSGFLGRIGFGPKIDLTGAADVIVAALNALSDRVAGFVGNLDVMAVRIPTIPFSSGKIDQAFVVADDNGDKMNLTVTADAIQPFGRLTSIAWLADGDRVTVLAQFVSGAPVTAAGKSDDVGDFDAKLSRLKSGFSEIEKQNFNLLSEPGGDWVGIAKPLVASLVNSSFAKAHASLHVTAQIAKQDFSKKVSLPNGEAIDCTPTKDCTPTENCDLHVDNRECKTCLASTFGHCRLHGNDLKCEAAKAVQNKLYQAQKAQCEANKGKTKVACEGEKDAQKGLCEGGKTAVEALDRTGNFANIDGSFGAGSATLDVGFSKVVISDALDNLNIALLLSAQGTADTHLKFTPLDIVGHLTCQIPWTNDKKVSVTVPPQSFNLTAVLQGQQGGTSVSYSTKITTSGLVAQMNPSPRDLILTSYNMTLSCLPVAPLIHALNLSIAQFIPELNGILLLRGQQNELAFELKPIKQTVMGVDVEAHFTDTGKAFLAVGGPISQ